ncbi:hypothetical protein GCM10022243_06310 [Saccharothrix violaceirubra]|uniref:Uncharacterized protein n=1 Tax=Saccharothrix violaceirubra TaxID=413306 RepID=A0A7W7SY07_9PSEU|nr:hypothetical protein [Saccharothrix violaceirubra]MBB4963043.1 hypothetical protein [Saccharothrix violaceirubra]
MPLDPHQYRELLSATLPSAFDADTFEPHVRTLFTPDSHRRALDPDATVVKGGRGVGKTVWFKSLQDEELRRLAAAEYRLPRLTTIRALPGYGTALLPDRYPSQRTLDALTTEFADAADIWLTVVLHAVGAPDINAIDNWADRVRWLLAHPEAAERALAHADQEAASTGTTPLFLFDALDRLHSRRDITDRLVEGILRVALDLRTRTRNLRAKVFIRHDMFDGIRLTFPDASKLTANAADLTWSPPSLYGLLFHQMGNADHALSDDFIAETGGWNSTEFRKAPPHWLTSDHEQQRKVFERMAGPYMGRDHRKGIVYTWLPNHLTDGLGQVSPRSFLSALRKATDVTGERFFGHEYALHWDGIRQGVQTASGIRVVEVREDIPWVSTAIVPLGGLQVPIETQDVIQRWEERDLKGELIRLSEATPSADGGAPAPTGPLTTDYPKLIGELVELGVMSRRANGKLDLPDVYRIAFDLGRKGGVPRVRQ